MLATSRLTSSLLCAAVAVAVGCGGGGSKSPPAGPPASAVVGTSGGAVTTSDGNIAVTVPAGALGSNVTITVEPAAEPASGAVSTVYEIGPTGTQFATPVTLTLHYDDSMLGGMPASSLRVATFASGGWQILPGATVDTQAKTVSGLTTHLSPYAIVAAASGRTCAQIQGGLQCMTAPTGGGSGGSSTGTADAGVGANTGAPKTDGTGTSPTCTALTCASAANACAPYPGATLDSCTDGTDGYTGSCCFPSGGPICFAIGGGASTCDKGPNGAGTCPPAPTCATATGVCAGYPGATLQNCVDGPSGFTGACCFAAENPVCISTGAGRACADGGSCPPPPRCADANPCAGYAGATVGSCTDTTDGYQAACCFPLGTLPPPNGGAPRTGPAADGGTSSGTGATTGSQDGGVGGTTGGGTAGTTGGDKTDGGAAGTTGGAAGTTGTDGGAGTTGGGTCQPGAACPAGSGGCSTGDPATGACQMCTCDAGGVLVCNPCPGKDAGGPPPSDGGAGGAGGTTGGGTAGTTGGGTCQPGAACAAGSGGCSTGDPTTGACLMCACDAGGVLVCNPCPGKDAGGPPPSDGGAGGTTGGGACQPGAACQPGSGGCATGDPATGACLMCTCDQGGVLVCNPCPDKDGGAPPPPPPSDGGAMASCQVNTMPPTGAGTPCGVVEMCSDGTNYRVRCDGVSGQCDCLMNGNPVATISLSCDTLDPKAALGTCKFPTP